MACARGGDGQFSPRRPPGLLTGMTISGPGDSKVTEFREYLLSSTGQTGTLFFLPSTCHQNPTGHREHESRHGRADRNGLAHHAQLPAVTLRLPHGLLLRRGRERELLRV